MTPNLNQLNERFAKAGLAARLDPAGAARLKDAAPRERVLHALTRVETHDDAGARAFLEKTFRAAGLTGETSANNARQPQQPAHTQPESAAAPAHAPQRPVDRRPPPETGHGGSAAPNAAPAPSQARQRPQHHVYGGRAALTFELDETPAGAPTVALDGANSIGERKFDWQNKVRIQFTTRELPVVAATLLGILPECQFSNHGPANDKGFEITWQGDRQSFFVKVWQGKGNLRAVPMPREDAFYAAQLVLRAIQQGSPARLDTAGVIATLRAFYGRV